MKKFKNTKVPSSAKWNVTNFNGRFDCRRTLWGMPDHPKPLYAIKSLLNTQTEVFCPTVSPRRVLQTKKSAMQSNDISSRLCPWTTWQVAVLFLNQAGRSSEAFEKSLKV